MLDAIKKNILSINELRSHERPELIRNRWAVHPRGNEPGWTCLFRELSEKPRRRRSVGGLTYLVPPTIEPVWRVEEIQTIPQIDSYRLDRSRQDSVYPTAGPCSGSLPMESLQTRRGHRRFHCRDHNNQHHSIDHAVFSQWSWYAVWRTQPEV